MTSSFILTSRVAGGVFGDNVALDGGVVFVAEGGTLVVDGGVYEGNSADNGGGVFHAQDNGYVIVSIPCVSCLIRRIVRYFSVTHSDLRVSRSVGKCCTCTNPSLTVFQAAGTESALLAGRWQCMFVW